jgi:hypothetical protein
VHALYSTVPQTTSVLPNRRHARDRPSTLIASLQLPHNESIVGCKVIGDKGEKSTVNVLTSFSITITIITTTIKIPDEENFIF